MNKEKIKNMDIHEIKKILSSLIERKNEIYSKPPKTRELYKRELNQIKKDLVDITGFIEDKAIMI